MSSLIDSIKNVWKDPVFSKIISVALIGFFSYIITIIMHFNNVGYFYFVCIIFLIFSLTAAILCLFFQRFRYRETYSLFASISIIAIILIILISFAKNSMPWDIRLSTNPFNIISIKTIVTKKDYILLLVLSTVIIYLIHSSYKNWHGLKSTLQSQKEEKYIRSYIFTEGLLRMQLFLKNEILKQSIPQTKSHIEIIANEEVISISWPNQARELIILYSTSYDFNIDHSWHDTKKCWIGLNQRSDGLVVMYPIREELEFNQLEPLVDYASTIAKKQSRFLEEIIIISKEEVNIQVNNIKQIPISIHNEQSLLNNIANFADYKHDIKYRANNTPLVESTLSLKDVYVAPIVKSPLDDIGTDLESYVASWLVEPGRRHIALLGDYGQGKSTAALMLTHNILSRQQTSPPRIPILIELRGKYLRDQEPVDILGLWGGRYGINGQALLRLHEAGRLLLIFEGFDEMSQLSDYETRRRYFKAIWAFSAYPKSKIIITGRPNLFESTEELNAALGIPSTLINTSVLNGPRCIPLKLQPFDIDQIKSALRSQPLLVRNQIIERAQTDLRFADLISRPSLLHVVAVLWEQERLYEKTLTSAYVIGLFVHNSYNRQANKEKIVFQFSGLTSSELSYFMSGIATYMASNELSNITNSQLNEVIENLLNTIPNNFPEKSLAIRNETDVPLKERLKDPETKGYSRIKLDQLFTDVRSSGLLVVDSATTSAFKFGHKSFMEYLFAEVLANNILEVDLISVNAILLATGSNINKISKQKTSSIFLAEILSGNSFIKPSNSKLTTSEIDDFNHSVVKSSFNALLKKRLFLFIDNKSLVKIVAIIRSISIRKPRLYSYYILSTLIILGISPFILLISSLFKDFRVFDESAGLISVVATFVCLIAFIFMFILFATDTAFLQDSPNQLTTKLRIWLLVCYYCEIPDKIIIDFLGLNNYSTIKNKSFVYFYNRTELLYYSLKSFIPERIAYVFGKYYTDTTRSTPTNVSTISSTSFLHIVEIMSISIHAITKERSYKNNPLKDKLLEEFPKENIDTLLIKHVERSIILNDVS